jgi:histidine kinase
MTLVYISVPSVENMSRSFRISFGIDNFSESNRLNIHNFIFSEQARTRRFRHGIFWSVYCLYFYVQSISPKQFNDFFDSSTYYCALLSLVSYAPVCMLTVYFFRSYLLNLVKCRRYLRVVVVFVSTYAAGTFINYFTAAFFLAHVRYSIPVINNFQHRLEFANYNTRWAMIVGIIVLGFSLAKCWYLKSRENLVMLRINARAEMRIQKSRIHPLWLFRALDKITRNLYLNSGTSTAMILNLSDLLSYSLYDSDAELVSLDKELSELEHLVAVEQLDLQGRVKVHVEIEGLTDTKLIAPMSVINRVVDHITSLPDPGGLPCTMKLSFLVRKTILDLVIERKFAGEILVTKMHWSLTRGVAFDSHLQHTRALVSSKS